MEESTPRTSKRLRIRSQRTFHMPSRDTVLDQIESSPGKHLSDLKPRKIINNFFKERNSYNNRNDMPELSHSDSLSDFIYDGDVEGTPRPKKTNSRKREKRRSRVAELSDSSSDEGEPERQETKSIRLSERIKRQPKKIFHKPTKKEVMDEIVQRRPLVTVNTHQAEMNEDLSDFVVDDDYVEELEDETLDAVVAYEEELLWDSDNENLKDVQTRESKLKHFQEGKKNTKENSRLISDNNNAKEQTHRKCNSSLDRNDRGDGKSDHEKSEVSPLIIVDEEDGDLDNCTPKRTNKSKRMAITSDSDSAVESCDENHAIIIKKKKRRLLALQSDSDCKSDEDEGIFSPSAASYLKNIELCKL